MKHVRESDFRHAHSMLPARRFPNPSWVRRFLVLAAGGSLFALGCNVSRPQLSNPGHRYTQQLRATYYDPYADPDAAPEFDGARPRDYMVPRSEPVQSQWYFGKR